MMPLLYIQRPGYDLIREFTNTLDLNKFSLVRTELIKGIFGIEQQNKEDILKISTSEDKNMNETLVSL